MTKGFGALAWQVSSCNRRYLKATDRGVLQIRRIHTNKSDSVTGAEALENGHVSVCIPTMKMLGNPGAYDRH